MSALVKTRVSCSLAVVICSLFGVGAPPSELVRGPSVWLRFEPLMVPLLSFGVLLAVTAFLLSLATTRAAAYVCIAATSATMLGMALAWAINAEAGLRAFLFPLAFLSAPALGAAEALLESRRERLVRGGAPVEGSAG
jgi:hypothetical protein